MASVYEILQQTGFTPSEIRQLDERAINAFSNVLSQAENERAANVAFYEGSIAPALVSWGTERDELEASKAQAERQARYYRAAAESAGILPSEHTPGTPQFTGGNVDANDLVSRASRGLAEVSDIYHRYPTFERETA